MTHYKKYDEAQRNDPELRAAIKAELAEQYAVLKAAKNKLEAAYKLLVTASAIEEDELDQSSGLHEARVNTLTAIHRFNYKIEHPPTETYIGNVAAGMSPEKAQELKEKYRGGMDS